MTNCYEIRSQDYYYYFILRTVIIDTLLLTTGVKCTSWKKRLHYSSLFFVYINEITLIIKHKYVILILHPREPPVCFYNHPWMCTIIFFLSIDKTLAFFCSHLYASKQAFTAFGYLCFGASG